MNLQHAKLALFVVEQEIRKFRANKATDNPLYPKLIGTAASLRREVKKASN